MTAKAKKSAKARGGSGSEAKSTNEPEARASRRPSKRAESRRGGAHAKAGSVREDTARRSVKTTADRNVRADRSDQSYVLEASDPSKRPSRKSTRRAENRVKPDANLRRRQTRRVRSPKNRSQMRAG